MYPWRFGFELVKEVEAGWQQLDQDKIPCFPVLSTYYLCFLGGFFASKLLHLFHYHCPQR